MTTYPVHYSVDRPARFARLQLAIRFIAFMALGVLGLSFGTVFLFAYLALPVYAASRLGGRDPEGYARHDAPRILNALRWYAALAAWAGLTAEHLPGRSPGEIVHMEIEGVAPTHSAGQALARVIYGVPSALVLALLCWVGMFVWLWAALSILFVQRVGEGAFGYLVGLQRWTMRLLAYQASLVDDYPPFSFSDAPPPALPEARVAS